MDKGRLKESLSKYKCGDLLGCLKKLDILDDDNGGNCNELKLRALLRKEIGDYEGAHKDIIRAGQKRTVIEARILVQMGHVDEASVLLKDLYESLPHNGKNILGMLGIAGRRMDLSLIGFDDDYKWKGSTRTGIEHYDCLVEHLLSLGRYDVLKDIKEKFEQDYPENDYIQKLKRLTVTSLNEITNNKEIQKMIKGVRGWLSFDEAYILNRYAGAVSNKNNIVELGSWYGRSTISLSYGSKLGHGAKVHAIDPHEGLQGIGNNSMENLSNNLKCRSLENCVTIHCATSIDISSSWKERNVGLLFIDALHDYETVKSDYLAWKDKMVKGGIIAFHDSVQPGPNRMILEILKKEKEVIPIGIMDSIFFFKYENKDGGYDSSAFWWEFMKERGNNYVTYTKRNKQNMRDNVIVTYERIIGECDEQN